MLPGKSAGRRAPESQTPARFCVASHQAGHGATGHLLRFFISCPGMIADARAPTCIHTFRIHAWLYIWTVPTTFTPICNPQSRTQTNEAELNVRVSTCSKKHCAITSHCPPSIPAQLVFFWLLEWASYHIRLPKECIFFPRVTNVQTRRPAYSLKLKHVTT